MSTATLALIGDYSDRHTAHRAIPRALELAVERAGVDVSWEWVPTASIGDAARDLAGYAAAWLVPATPYENPKGAMDAARWAREGRRPVLGTCGGFQHMLIEFARNVAGLPGADTSETAPCGHELVVTRLSCSLVEVTGDVHFAPGSLLARAYGGTGATEGYRCNYGINPAYRAAFEAAGLSFTSWDAAGDIRGAELPLHPFYAGVLFQPERTALAEEAPALAVAFVRAAASAV